LARISDPGQTSREARKVPKADLCIVRRMQHYEAGKSGLQTLNRHRSNSRKPLGGVSQGARRGMSGSAENGRPLSTRD
jgi:hypothetical protein